MTSLLKLLMQLEVCSLNPIVWATSVASLQQFDLIRWVGAHT